MDEWRTDPTFAMCRALTDGADLSSFVGGPFDVRAVVTAMRPEVKDGFLLDEVPWENFPQGDRVREAIDLLHTGNSPVRTGRGVVGGMCANDMRAAAVLAVPFLIRIAADPRHPYRADALAEVSAPACARHFSVASRGELLLHRADTQADDLYDDYGVEVTGYPAGWSVAAARAAITADATLLKPLLHDPDPEIRIRAAYALAATTDLDRARSVSPSAPASTPSRTRASRPPWSSPQPKPPAPSPIRRLPCGCESAGGTERKRPRPSWPPRSGGSASPTNPSPTTCAQPSTTSPLTSTHTPWMTCLGWLPPADPTRRICGAASERCATLNTLIQWSTTTLGLRHPDGGNRPSPMVQLRTGGPGGEFVFGDPAMPGTAQALGCGRSLMTAYCH